MRYLMIFFFALLLQSSFTAEAFAQATNSDAMVVLTIDGLDDEMLAKLASQIGKERNYSLEYSCTWSDVLVLHLGDVNTSDRGDVVTLVRRLLFSAGIERNVEFLDVHVELKGVNKC